MFRGAVLDRRLMFVAQVLLVAVWASKRYARPLKSGLQGPLVEGLNPIAIFQELSLWAKTAAPAIRLDPW